MASYLLRKIGFMLLSLFILITATFVLMKSIPGDPFATEKPIPKEIRANLDARYGLDKPLHVQYWMYLKNVAKFDLGISMKTKHLTVTRIIKDSFGYSLQLGVVSLIVSAIVGVGLGVIAALRHQGFIDNTAMTLSIIGVSAPSFVIAPILQYILGVKLGWLNVARLNGPLDFIMPTIALSALSIAFIARLTRSSMLEALSSDYIKTAKSKGLSESAITIRHALRNAILPVVTFFGPLTANVITGSVIVERIFGIPGLGKYFVDSVLNRDYPLIMGITIFYAIILMVARFATDFVYVLVDPRIKLIDRKDVV